MAYNPFFVAGSDSETVSRDGEGKIISGISSLIPTVVTQEVLERVAKDPTIVGVLLKDPSGKFQAGTQVELLKEDKWYLDSNEMFLSRLRLFGGGGRPQ